MPGTTRIDDVSVKLSGRAFRVFPCCRKPGFRTLSSTTPVRNLRKFERAVIPGPTGHVALRSKFHSPELHTPHAPISSPVQDARRATRGQDQHIAASTCKDAEKLVVLFATPLEVIHCTSCLQSLRSPTSFTHETFRFESASAALRS
jgi:hypothetical protein